MSGHSDLWFQVDWPQISRLSGTSRHEALALQGTFCRYRDRNRKLLGNVLSIIFHSKNFGASHPSNLEFIRKALIQFSYGIKITYTSQAYSGDLTFLRFRIGGERQR